MLEMKKEVRLFGYFLIRFGFWNGTKLLTRFYSGKVQRLKIPNIKHRFGLRRHTSDVFAFHQVFINNEYNLDWPKDAKTIIDGGANIGLFSIKVKNLYPNAKVVCVEPDPENFYMLQKNLSQYDGISLENAGIWNKDVALKVYDKFQKGKWAMVVEEDNENGTVNAVSIPSLIKKYNIDYIDILKLDIETSEKLLFLENYEQWLSKVKVLIIELHDWIEPNCAKPFFEAINKVFPSYRYHISGENTIIWNTELIKRLENEKVAFPSKQLSILHTQITDSV